MRRLKAKIILLYISIILLALFLFFSSNQVKLPIEIKDKVVDYAIGNINGDNIDYLVVLTGSRGRKFGKEVIIYSLKDMKEIYRRNFSEFKPWKIAIGDIDGDGKDEVSVGMYKKSPFHQVMAKRPFIYSFENGRLEPKWRGSRLSKPFTDYDFYDIDGDSIDEIISVEILESNRKIINTYKWKGFGFEGYLESKDYEDLKDLTIENERLNIGIKEGRDKYLGVVKLKDNNLIIERED
ncbi:hypothetical protein SAMN02745784_02321 [Tissierella praeacuta DSM 18095]|uniref:Repeat domain-containing protein n=1 Tax=Tissierella praeacuta DSM 18095 TaxID=1123404 RepID=A0A1M4XNR9_9FIRM|nr:hypothetical protein [Tissierella praeacuta]SHE95088.1 hypothetical protein SAMN02745784_02321 [Tissierella praeacuta DSM 18095]SUO99804.1 Uncharacterised protein [Tissierella praeacuta]